MHLEHLKKIRGSDRLKMFANLRSDLEFINLIVLAMYLSI